MQNRDSEVDGTFNDAIQKKRLNAVSAHIPIGNRPFVSCQMVASVYVIMPVHAAISSRFGDKEEKRASEIYSLVLFNLICNPTRFCYF